MHLNYGALFYKAFFFFSRRIMLHMTTFFALYQYQLLEINVHIHVFHHLQLLPSLSTPAWGCYIIYLITS